MNRKMLRLSGIILAVLFLAFAAGASSSGRGDDDSNFGGAGDRMDRLEAMFAKPHDHPETMRQRYERWDLDAMNFKGDDFMKIARYYGVDREGRDPAVAAKYLALAVNSYQKGPGVKSAAEFVYNALHWNYESAEYQKMLGQMKPEPKAQFALESEEYEKGVGKKIVP